MAMQELIDIQKTMDGGGKFNQTYTVLEKSSNIKNHHDVVTQLFEDQYPDSDQWEPLGFGVARGQATDRAVH
ncbi:uncharacterized protein N7506_003887 [Penicillium brevicompactum]|uniref:uncharacterized protein n=1 Tax=Penicillium brevicompactum TaxID=5074 RepID=UPI00253FD8D5|nr:uncharacterized protein N7506_003887 [Penicillium brevicompactum]KAJ5344063.1 hypothetical protein N7506_003887 [Penicillium brevicompactum]